VENSGVHLESRGKCVVTKGDNKMSGVIGIRDLPEGEVRLIVEFIEFLRERTKRKRGHPEGEEEIVFATWPLGVKGKLTRGGDL